MNQRLFTHDILSIRVIEFYTCGLTTFLSDEEPELFLNAKYPLYICRVKALTVWIGGART